MDLILTDSGWTDIGIIRPTAGDFAFGNEENDFSLTCSSLAPVPELRSLVYAPGSLLGGMVTGWKVNESGGLTVNGQTWTGILNRKILRPDPGSKHYSATGDVRDIVAGLITRYGLTSLFAVAPGKTGVSVTHKFQRSVNDPTQHDAGRFMLGWVAIWQVLTEHDCRCDIRWDDARRKALLTVAVAEDHYDDEATYATGTATTEERKTPLNHVLVLGSGTGLDRYTADFYADKNGVVSTTQSIFGVDEVADILDQSSTENTTEADAAGRKKLRESWKERHSIETTVTSDAGFALGDVVGGMNRRTGQTASATVTKVIATITKGGTVYQYKTD